MAKKGKEKQEKKPIKNYVILVLLFLAVIALTVYLCIMKNKKRYQ